MPSHEELEALAKEFTEDTKVENPTTEDVKGLAEDFVRLMGEAKTVSDETRLHHLGPRLMVKTLPNYHGLPDLKPATMDSVGIDLFSAISEPVWLNTMGAKAIVPTGISLQIPHGYEVQIRPRSGLAAKHGLTVLNSPGTIDPDYRGEIKVILVNTSTRKFMIERGMRIAQMVMAPVTIPRLYYVENLDETDRGEGGLGSTGV